MATGDGWIVHRGEQGRRRWQYRHGQCRAGRSRQENPLTNIQLFGLQRYHPFVTMTGHFHGIALVLCNARSLASWPDDVRSALSAAVSESTAAQWKLAFEHEVAAREALEAQGINIIDLDEAARSAFKQ